MALKSEINPLDQSTIVNTGNLSGGKIRFMMAATQHREMPPVRVVTKGEPVVGITSHKQIHSSVIAPSYWGLQE